MTGVKHTVSYWLHCYYTGGVKLNILFKAAGGAFAHNGNITWRNLPSYHGVEQDPQAPDVTGCIITLLLQNLHTHTHTNNFNRVQGGISLKCIFDISSITHVNAALYCDYQYTVPQEPWRLPCNRGSSISHSQPWAVWQNQNRISWCILGVRSHQNSECY